MRRVFIVTVPGIAPYHALASSSCEAIMDAQQLHGVHSAGAKPA